MQVEAVFDFYVESNLAMTCMQESDPHAGLARDLRGLVSTNFEHADTGKMQRRPLKAVRKNNISQHCQWSPKLARGSSSGWD